MPKLAIIIPCYNEEKVLSETFRQLTDVMNGLISRRIIDADSYAFLVDDGSVDKTWDVIEQLHGASKLARGLKLSRNFGHQNALLAGLFYADDADVLISIDSDLQDDLNAIESMIQKYAEGYEVVYGVRDDRSSDSFFKRATALFFYKLLSTMGVESVYNHADYRLMSQRALKAFKEFGEVNLYLRGMVPMVGFKQTSVYYKRGERFAGESKYSIAKMISFAWNGITSLSFSPLHFVTFCGFAIFFLSLGLAGYAFISHYFLKTTPGWASTVIPIYFLGGVQIFCIGLIGEYVGKIYKEVKHRPRFIIENELK